MKAFKTLIENRIKEFYKKFDTSYKFRKELVKSYKLEDFYGDRNRLRSLWIYCGPSEWDNPMLTCMWRPESTLEWHTVDFNDIMLVTNYLKSYFREEFPDLRLNKEEWSYLHERAYDATFEKKVFNREINYVDKF